MFSIFYNKGDMRFMLNVKITSLKKFRKKISENRIICQIIHNSVFLTPGQHVIILMSAVFLATKKVRPNFFCLSNGIMHGTEIPGLCFYETVIFCHSYILLEVKGNLFR